MSIFSSVRHSFVVKYISRLFLLIFLSLGIGFFFIYHSTKKLLMDSIQNEAWLIGQEKINLFGQSFKRYENMAEVMVFALGKVPQRKWENTLQTYMRSDPNYHINFLFLSATAVSTDDKVPSTTYTAFVRPDKTIETRHENDAAVLNDKTLQLIKTGKGQWIENSGPRTGLYWVIKYTLPIYQTLPDGTKKLVGVCSMAPNMDYINEQVCTAKLGWHGLIFAITDTKMFLAGPAKKNIGKFTSDIPENKRPFNITKDKEIWLEKQLQSAQKASFTLERKADGQQFICFFQRMARTPWFLCVVFPLEEIYAPIRSLRTAIILVTTCVFLILVCMGFAMIAHLSLPIKKLTHFAKEIGKGNFTEPVPNATGKDEIAVLSSTIDQMRFSLIKYIERIKEFTSVNERMASEMQIAHRIQQGLLPDHYPAADTVRRFDIYAKMDSAKEVGGDLYDCIMLAPGKIAFAIGDVSGKGIPASIFMAVTQMLQRTLWKIEDVSPRKIVSTMNKNLCDHNTGRMFVSFICGIIDAESQTMTYCNAGHDPFYILKNNGTLIAPCKRHGIPLGMRTEAVYTESDCKIEPQDTLVFYTDGIPEAENISHDFYSMERFISVLQKLANEKLSTEQLVHQIFDSVHAYAGKAEQSDDITCMAIKYLK